MAEGAQHPHAADAEHDFLAQPVPRIATIQVIGDAAVPIRVLRQVGIEQIDRHPAALGAGHLILPGADLHRAALDANNDPLWQLLEEILHDPLARFFGL